MEDKKEQGSSTGLTPIEIAAITAQVPCSGNPIIDRIISLSLRLRTAQAAMEGLLSGATGSGVPISPKEISTTALEYADALLSEFSRGK